jgi:hypothetical protein
VRAAAATSSAAALALPRVEEAFHRLVAEAEAVIA